MGNQEKLINNQRRIGLTGGIATGKTTISNYIRQYKRIPIVDSDNLSKELIKPNTDGYKKIIDHFGTKIIDNLSSEKIINRKLLREIIFRDEKQREWIQNYLHPLIKEKIIEKCYQYKNSRIVLLEIPLLFEAKFTDICTEIWLVKCPREIQVKRLIERDKIREDEASRIINIQLNFETKSKLSDIILDNSDKQSRWINQIKKLI